jgi:Ca-activated chloride channel homolog
MSHPLKRAPLVILIALAASAAGQNPPAANKNNKVIILPVAVWSSEGNYLKDLKAEQFELLDGKEVRSIELFESGDTPISVGIMIDVSGSMALPDLKEIMRPEPVTREVQHFIELSNPKNEYFLMAFGSQPRVLTDWTNGTGLAYQPTPLADKKSTTALFDACFMAMDKLQTAHHSRRVLIILSDGQDNSSKQKFKALRELVRRSDVLVYSIIVRRFPDYSDLGLEGRIVLEDLATATGGEVWIPADKAQLQRAIEELAADLHYQYRIGFQVSALTRNEWRKVKVRIKPAPNRALEFKRLTIRTREGYYPR